MKEYKFRTVGSYAMYIKPRVSIVSVSWVPKTRDCFITVKTLCNTIIRLVRPGFRLKKCSLVQIKKFLTYMPSARSLDSKTLLRMASWEK